jgi:hypothetical protein
MKVRSMTGEQTPQKTKKTKKTQSSIKVDKRDLEKANVEVLKKKITAEKDLKYLYPETADDEGSRKTFRRQARSKRDQYFRQIASSETPDKVRKEAIAWAKKVFTPAHIPNF